MAKMVYVEFEKTMTKPKREANASITVPFTVIIDTREQKPFRFAGLFADTRSGDRIPLIVPQLRGTLRQGDYSLLGFEDRIAIERKSLHDLFGTIAHERDRFNTELKRMSSMDRAAIIIEATWDRIMRGVRTTRMHPGAIYRFVREWRTLHPQMTWHFCDGVFPAMELAFGTLKAFYEEQGHASGL